MTDPDISITEITPELAADWLRTANVHNRSLRRRVVRAYAADMSAGNWRWNGESIKFAADGTLLDGQHRLAAIVASGCSLPMLVVGGLKNDAQETVDGGAKRKFSDVLALRGESNAIALASIARRVVLWEGGRHWVGAAAGNYAPTNAEMIQAIETYPVLRELARAASNIARQCPLPASIAGFCWWLFTQQADAVADADFFFARLADGQGLVKGDPVYELRRTIADSKTVRGQRSERFLTAITIKAWNAYQAGQTIAVLRFRSGGANPEPFPEPR